MEIESNFQSRSFLPIWQKVRLTIRVKRSNLSKKRIQKEYYKFLISE
ncbi:hypothetical protein LEP1GSC052_2455 [Leptospira kmetyi serovar Malaysia str. Bejo-Iso9]|nr:hypothetical protein LEP1GSC052_2455 [Leptospira kmetyi serovar Malaysia str. Bejo-Iso9]